MRARIISWLQPPVFARVLRAVGTLNEGQDYILATTGRSRRSCPPAVPLNEGQDYILATTRRMRRGVCGGPPRSMRARIISWLQPDAVAAADDAAAARSMRARIISWLQPDLRVSSLSAGQPLNEGQDYILATTCGSGGGGGRSSVRSMRARIISWLQRQPPVELVKRFARSMRARIISWLQLGDRMWIDDPAEVAQ